MEETIAKYVFRYLGYIKEWWTNKDVQMPVLEHESNSYFASKPEDIESVYEIRDSIFGEEQLSGSAYDSFLAKNPFAITLLAFNDSRQNVLKKLNSGKKEWAYYSIIPISEETYTGFIANQKEHKEVINESLSWTEALNQDRIYFYLVGIVVRKGLWQKEIKSSYALADMIEFLSTIFEQIGIEKIGGLCGYPSREEGLNLFEKRTHAFKDTGLIKDGNQIKKIFICENTGLKVLKDELSDFRNSQFYNRYKTKVHWNDKLLFLEAIDSVE